MNDNNNAAITMNTIINDNIINKINLIKKKRLVTILCNCFNNLLIIIIVFIKKKSPKFYI